MVSWTDIFKSWVGRKMVIYFTALISLTIMTAVGKLGESSYVAGLIAVVGAGISGNVLSKKFTTDSKVVEEGK